MVQSCGKIYWCKRGKLGLPQLPDGEFLKPMDMNCLEKEFKNQLKNYKDRLVTIGRIAIITEGTKPGLNRFNVNTEIDVGEVSIWGSI